MPSHGRWGTAAEIILEEPSAERNEVRKLSRFAASALECGFPAPAELGYSCGARAVRSSVERSHSRSAAYPVNVNSCTYTDMGKPVS